MFYLVAPRCPCYCGGEGLLLLVTCPECGAVMGQCDEVEELIPDLRDPVFVPDESICYPDQLCPVCGRARYGEFRPATETEIQMIGVRPGQYRAW